MAEIFQGRLHSKQKGLIRRVNRKKHKSKEERRPDYTRHLGAGGKGKPSGRFPSWYC